MAKTKQLSERKQFDALAAQVPLFAQLRDKYKYPGPSIRPRGFATLLLIILEQQVSLASARSVFDKLLTAQPKLTPKTFLKWRDDELRGFGYSRQKTRYSRLLAEAILDGSFDFEALADLSDDEARNYLMQLKGIGPWTADVYLMMAEGRQDFFPAGDLALQLAYKEQLGLDAKPDSKTLAAHAEAWQPYRSAAARWLWHGYLVDRGKL